MESVFAKFFNRGLFSAPVDVHLAISAGTRLEQQVKSRKLLAANGETLPRPAPGPLVGPVDPVTVPVQVEVDDLRRLPDQGEEITLRTLAGTNQLPFVTIHVGPSRAYIRAG